MGGGTTPLYAVRECFRPGHGVADTPENVLGVPSLIVWSLVIVIDTPNAIQRRLQFDGLQAIVLPIRVLES